MLHYAVHNLDLWTNNSCTFVHASRNILSFNSYYQRHILIT